MFSITKVSTEKFDDLETISEAYQIKNFSGQMSLNCSQYTEDVHQSIAIYILRGENVLETEITSIENGLISFNVEENDIFVAVFQNAN